MLQTCDDIFGLHEILTREVILSFHSLSIWKVHVHLLDIIIEMLKLTFNTHCVNLPAHVF